MRENEREKETAGWFSSVYLGTESLLDHDRSAMNFLMSSKHKARKRMREGENERDIYSQTERGFPMYHANWVRNGTAR